MNDVEEVAKLLGMDSIDVTLVKGKNNYLYRKRLNQFLKENDKEAYRYVLDAILKTESIDRKDFQEISDKMWKNINVTTCSNMACLYFYNCKLIEERQNYKNAKIVITNRVIKSIEDAIKFARSKEITGLYLLDKKELAELESTAKLIQGTERAIRSEEDTAVISILGFRIYDYNTKYDNMIFQALPITLYKYYG